MPRPDESSLSSVVVVSVTIASDCVGSCCVCQLLSAEGLPSAVLNNSDFFIGDRCNGLKCFQVDYRQLVEDPYDPDQLQDNDGKRCDRHPPREVAAPVAASVSDSAEDQDERADPRGNECG